MYLGVPVSPSVPLLCVASVTDERAIGARDAGLHEVLYKQFYQALLDIKQLCYCPAEEAIQMTSMRLSDPFEPVLYLNYGQ